MTATPVIAGQLEFWSMTEPMFPAVEEEARCDFHGYHHRFTTCQDAAGEPHEGYPLPGAVKTSTPTAYMVRKAAEPAE